MSFYLCFSWLLRTGLLVYMCVSWCPSSRRPQWGSRCSACAPSALTGTETSAGDTFTDPCWMQLINVFLRACLCLRVWVCLQLPRGDVMEQGEGDGNPPVESSRGDSDMAGRCALCGPRGAGVWHAGDAIQRQKAARVPAASGADHQLHEGKMPMQLSERDSF